MRLWTAFMEVLFPARCCACRQLLRDDRLGQPFCASCAAQIRPVTPPCCPRCGLPYPESGQAAPLCGDCASSLPAFDAARALAHYEGPLHDALRAFKYRGDCGIGGHLGQWMAEQGVALFPRSDWTRVLPVPLHRDRLRERGYNQSLILARSVARRLEAPLDARTLVRRLATPPQVALGREGRKANVRGAFGVQDPSVVSGERILLVDDVMTTGSTLHECAAVLKKAGARSVSALTLARAVH